MRAAEGDCWIVVGIDDFNAKLPWQWFDIVKVRGPYGDEGVRFEQSDAGMVPLVGPVGRRLFAVYRRSVATWARQGFNVLVDEVTFDAEAARDWDEALAGLPVSWVAVRCDPNIAAERERARGDRVLGLATGLSAVVHEHRTYDYEIDAGSASPEELAVQLAELLTK
jgi:chloramphenicol 3-O phosphotransferase